jgi:hypothetical protein
MAYGRTHIDQHRRGCAKDKRVDRKTALKRIEASEQRQRNRTYPVLQVTEE